MPSSRATSAPPSSSPKRMIWISGCSSVQLFMALRWITAMWPRKGFAVVKMVSIFSVGVRGRGGGFRGWRAKAEANVMDAVGIFEVRQKAPAINYRAAGAGAKPFFFGKLAEFLPGRGQHGDAGCRDAGFGRFGETHVLGCGQNARGIRRRIVNNHRKTNRVQFLREQQAEGFFH